MDYQGFHSLAEYERESARAGHKTRRVPFHKNGERFFALISTPPEYPGSGIESWTLFSEDETARVLDGVINGHNENYLGKLAAQGFYPLDAEEDAPVIEAAPVALDLHESPDDLPQYILPGF